MPTFCLPADGSRSKAAVLSKFPQLLTWQDIVKQFEAQSLVRAIRISLDDAHILAQANLPPNSPAFRTVVEKTLAAEFQKLLECCKEADLRMSVIAIERVIEFCSENYLNAIPQLVKDGLCDNIKKAIMTVEDELSLRSYFSLEPKEADYFNKPWAGWESIINKYDETIRDIEEMNKCFALCRYPAAMFHALHVAEWGAIKLGDYIGVTDPKKGWGPTKSRLSILVKGGHANLPPNLNNKWNFIEQMNREIDSLTLAWRHKVDHAVNHLAIVPNAEFTPDIAEHIIGAIRVFMLRLVEEC